MGSIDDASGQRMKTGLHDYARRRRTDGPYADNLDIDVLIVGGGFGGIYALYDIRKAFPEWKTVMYEAGVGYGGVWRFNIYPGARADSPVPIYQLSIPEVDEDFYWPTNYPNWEDLQRYFDHCDKKLSLSKDTAFESVVTRAEFDTTEGKWTVKTHDGRTCKTRFLVICAGFAAKRHFPEIPGIESYKGTMHHSSFWPMESVDYKGKKLAVIGTGASGVQITQETGPHVEQLTVYQRTPNLAIPMGKRALTKEEQDRAKADYPTIHAYRERCFGGFHYDLCERNTFDDNEEEREKFFHELVFERQGFALWLGGYKDYLFDMDANRQAYDYWYKHMSKRVKNPEKRKILFPKEPKHPFGVKRPSLEQNYYEVLDRDNVDVVDISKEGTPIERFTEKGIVTGGKEREFDIVCLATGFDVITGGLTNMGLKSIHGTYLKDEWKEGAQTYLGTTISGYPNLFNIYGAHGPTLLSNGPTCVEIQARWVRDCMKFATRQHIKYINPSAEAQAQWKKRINDLARPTLFPAAPGSTYMGGGLPGKAVEMTCYTGGLHNYAEEIRGKLQGWQGFETVQA